MQPVAKSVSVPLTDCFNTSCVCNEIFPDELTLATPFPVFKPDEDSDKENHRPISILPTLSKVFDKVTLNFRHFFVVCEQSTALRRR